MAFMSAPEACDNCGKDLSDMEDVIRDGNHEFCSEDCRKDYDEEHDHEEEGEEEVCEFC